jgi:hypothetical protein
VVRATGDTKASTWRREVGRRRRSPRAIGSCRNLAKNIECLRAPKQPRASSMPEHASSALTSLANQSLHSGDGGQGTTEARKKTATKRTWEDGSATAASATWCRTPRGGRSRRIGADVEERAVPGVVERVPAVSTSLIRVSTRTTREERSRCEQLRREADERQRSPNTK